MIILSLARLRALYREKISRYVCKVNRKSFGNEKGNGHNLYIAYNLKRMMFLTKIPDGLGPPTEGGLPKEITPQSIEGYCFLFDRLNKLWSAVVNKRYVREGREGALSRLIDFGYWTAMRLYEVVYERLTRLRSYGAPEGDCKYIAGMVDTAERWVSQFDDTHPFLKELLESARQNAWKTGRSEPQYRPDNDGDEQEV